MKKEMLILVLFVLISLIISCAVIEPILESPIERSDDIPTEKPIASDNPRVSQSSMPTSEPEPTSTPYITTEPTPTPYILTYPVQGKDVNDENAIKLLSVAFVELPYGRYGVIPNDLNTEDIFTIKYSDGLTDFSIGGEAYGPDCFDVYNNMVYICNSYGNSILIYKEGQLEKVINYEGSFVTEISVDENSIKLISNAGYGYQTISTGIDNHEITFPFGKEHYPNIISYKLIDINTVQLVDYNVNIEIAGNFKSINTLAKFDDAIYVLIKEESQAKYRIIERNVYIIEKGVVVNKVRLLESPYAMVMPSPSVIVDEKGNIYQMFYDENFDVHVYKLKLNLVYLSSIRTYNPEEKE